MEKEVLENNEGKKHIDKKTLISILVVAGILIILVVVSFLYIKFKFTAPKFIDTKVAEFANSVDKMLSGYESVDYDSVSLTGDVSLTTNINELASFNGLSLELDGKYSSAKRLADINLALLKNSENLLGGNIHVLDSRVYFDFQSLYNQVLYTDLGQSLFGNVDSDKIDINKMNIAIKNLAKYVAIAVKESDVKSSLKGTKAIYTYTINDNNKTKFLNTLNELIGNDEDVLNMFGLVDFDGHITDIYNMMLVVEVSIPSEEVLGFNLTIGDYTISLEEVAKDTYKLIINNDLTFDITVEGNNINIFYQDSERKVDITLNMIDYTVNSKITNKDEIITFSIINEDENTMSCKLVVENGGISTSTSNYKLIFDENGSLKVNGTLEVKLDNYYIEVQSDMVVKYGNDLVEDKTFSNVKDINTLSDEERTSITNKLSEVILKLFPSFGGNDLQNDYQVEDSI